MKQLILIINLMGFLFYSFLVKAILFCSNRLISWSHMRDLVWRPGFPSLGFLSAPSSWEWACPPGLAPPSPPTHLVLISSTLSACTPAPTQPIYLQHERLQLLHRSLPGCCLIYCGLKGSVRKDSCFDLESCPVSRLSTTTQATCSPLPQKLPSLHPLTALWTSVYVPSLPFPFFSNNIKPWKLGFCLSVLHLGSEVWLRLQSVALVLTRCFTTFSSHQAFLDWMLGL